MTTTRVKNIHKRQRRQRKVRYLRRRIQASKTFEERERLVEKLRKLSRNAPIPE